MRKHVTDEYANAYINEHFPFIEGKPMEEWTDEEREGFNMLMDALFYGWTRAIDDEIRGNRSREDAE